MLHIFSFEFLHGDANRNGILLDVPENTELTAIETELHTVLRPTFLSADLILLRFPPWNMRQPEPLSNELKGISRIAGRFPSASIQILSTHNYQHLIGDNLSQVCDRTLVSKTNTTTFLNCLRNLELREMIRLSDSLLIADRNYKFRLPSRAFSDYFLRVGNLQTNSHNLDTLFFWMLPHLAGVEGILVDTWSIGSIALNCSRLVERYDPKRKHNFRVEIQGSYVDSTPETRSELSNLIERASNRFSSQFLFVFSATMTGRSMQNAISTLESKKLSPHLMQLLVLYRLADNNVQFREKPVPHLCDFGETDLYCFATEHPQQKTAIGIDRSTYFPVFVKEKQVYLLKTIASKNADFFRNYESSNCIRVHADNNVGSQYYRHHGIYLDIMGMLQEHCFQRKLKTIIEKFPQAPQLIIVPPHDAGEALADFIATHCEKIMGFRPQVVIHLDLGHSDSPAITPREQQDLRTIHKSLRALKNTDTIVVLDDVVTTGRRLLLYQKRLRDIEYKGQIHYLIGVQRMPSATAFNQLEATLTPNILGKQHEVISVESVVLPNWDRNNCPLCVEKALLTELIVERSLQVSDWMNSRLQLLKEATNVGLSDNVFLQPPNTSPMKLTINSFFAGPDAPQSVVLGSVASAIQELREWDNSEKRLQPTGFPVRSVFAAKDLCRYTDGILRASILRSLVPKELQRTSPEKEKPLIEWGTSLLTASGENERSTQPEVALAVGLGKLPVETANEGVRSLLKKRHLEDLILIMEAGKM